MATYKVWARPTAGSGPIDLGGAWTQVGKTNHDPTNNAVKRLWDKGLISFRPMIDGPMVDVAFENQGVFTYFTLGGKIQVDPATDLTEPVEPDLDIGDV